MTQSGPVLFASSFLTRDFQKLFFVSLNQETFQKGIEDRFTTVLEWSPFEPFIFTFHDLKRNDPMHAGPESLCEKLWFAVLRARQAGIDDFLYVVH